MTTIPDCTPDLLRSLFLFEGLTDEQLEYLCDHGKVVLAEPGWLYRQGDAAICFYVLLDGSVVRLPSTRVDDASGKTMEQAPRQVDIPVKRPVGESYSGRDSQLDTAVRELLTQLGRPRATQ